MRLDMRAHRLALCGRLRSRLALPRADPRKNVFASAHAVTTSLTTKDTKDTKV
jgi:hypothetical protein